LTPTEMGAHLWPTRERRDVASRISRDVVAAHYCLHPSYLAGLPPLVVDLMAARIEGNRTLARRLAQRLPNRGALPLRVHRPPWTGEVARQRAG
jgi:hypothetical protein